MADQPTKLSNGQTVHRWSQDDNKYLPDFIRDITLDGSKVVTSIPLVYYHSTGVLQIVLIITQP